MPLYEYDGRLLEGQELADAEAAVAAGTRLKVTTSNGERLLSAAEEAAKRAEWAAAETARQIEQAAAAAAQADIEAARQFARLVALRTMTPAEVSAYISTRYPAPAASLAEANTILTKMRDDIETLAIAVAVLARRL